jgi:hypothetical protein
VTLPGRYASHVAWLAFPVVGSPTSWHALRSLSTFNSCNHSGCGALPVVEDWGLFGLIALL